MGATLTIDDETASRLVEILVDHAHDADVQVTGWRAAYLELAMKGRADATRDGDTGGGER